MIQHGRRLKNQGPGRGTPRSRTITRPADRASKSRSGRVGQVAGKEPDDVQQNEAPLATQLTIGIHFTRRAVFVGAILVILLFSYATSLRIYLNQERDIAEAKRQIAERSAKIGRLEDEIARWQDPAYVRTQARERLGWVVPGETGYRVVDANGKVLGGGTEIDKVGGLPKGEHPQTWWERMRGSVQTADDPIPVAKR